MGTLRSASGLTPYRHLLRSEESEQLRTREIVGPEGFTVPPEFAEDAIALAFTKEHGNKLRYTAAFGRWNVWNGTRWEPDC